MPDKTVELTNKQRKKLERLWFIYGNGGKHHTMGNHRFIQDILTRGEYDYKFFSQSKLKGWAVTEECKQEVDKILETDDS